jgi:SAM-dependent methyltransferase
MERDRISRLAHFDHPIAAPLDDEAVGQVLRHALPVAGSELLDLGCGGAEWLIRALEYDPAGNAVGVDLSEPALTHAHEEASRRGVAGRLLLQQEDAADFWSSQSFDVVISVGSTHAFGGLAKTLAAARKYLAPGGRIVIGDGFWAAPPSEWAVENIGTFDDLAGVVAAVVADGWTPVHGHVSTRAELDAYEWSWTGSLASWALDRRGTVDGEQALAESQEHLDGWLRGYRDTFGFVTLVLRRTEG